MCLKIFVHSFSEDFIPLYSLISRRLLFHFLECQDGHFLSAQKWHQQYKVVAKRSQYLGTKRRRGIGKIIERDHFLLSRFPLTLLTLFPLSASFSSIL